VFIRVHLWLFSMSDHPLAAELSAAIAARSARVAVLGLGYAGLPLAEVFVHAGFPVLGFDIDTSKIAKLRDGKSYLGHIPDARIAALIATRRFEPTDDPERLADGDAFLICVPTPLTEHREPNLSSVAAASLMVGRYLRRGRLVVLESTTYPGTTRDVAMPMLQLNGLVCGTDFFLAYSPEREDPGNREFTTGKIPRVVGGIDEASGRMACALYAAALETVVPVSSAEAAEASKILENTYRAVNIALVNELKVLCHRMNLDVWEVIEAAKTKPFGFQAFYPGPGIGGHCIPIDPYYLTWVARKHGAPARFVELAGEINHAMPQYVVSRLAEALTRRGKEIKGSRILLLGMAYKPDVDDARESPGLELAHLLTKKDAEVGYHDPLVPRIDDERRDIERTSEELTEELLRNVDAVVIVTDHSTYDWNWIAAHAPLLIDTRNATRHVAGDRGHIVDA
jgi:UDP-N-acetyl-D-glucosamine dehydrogenase